MTTLDPRPARGDLTSRECAKLLSGILAGAVGGGLPPVALRNSLIVLRETTRTVGGDRDRAAEALQILNGMPVLDALQLQFVFLMLGATCGTLSEQAAPDALGTALDWIIERGDDYWSAMQQGLAAARAAVPTEN